MYQIRQFVLKVASRCNLNCSYCYVYNKGDATWRQRPALMSDAVFAASLQRIKDYCASNGLSSVSIGFHGGEPCLIGPAKLDEWCKTLHRSLCGIDLHITIQTNATLLNDRWIDVITRNGLEVGVSLDGSASEHNENRPDHKGRPTHQKTMRGIAILRKANIRFGVICVIPLHADPVAVHRYLLQTGASEVSYLFPDHTHETPPHLESGQTPCADFLLKILGEWLGSGGQGPKLSDLSNMCRVVMGGESRHEMIGNNLPGYLFIETDGSLGGLDVLSICEPGLPGLERSVFDGPFEDIDAARFEGLKAAIFGQPTPSACQNCVESRTCAGGHLPHRYSRRNGFDNPSVWCGDLLKLFRHIRSALGVDHDETERLRAQHSRLDQAAAAGGQARRPMLLT
ncbi:radical SAM protein [Bradyrhizobium brasilense]|uniref:radical SAM protein n=1 Tax=Bradyrhizobium brasilense TaxID=1419277 RepID=UPI001E335A0D|nr:radical SAM protein [Bradyrhizobium brasilense]MCC8969773.1 radical SAM protein [Bradyrhizobium brasilense]